MPRWDHLHINFAKCANCCKKKPKILMMKIGKHITPIENYSSGSNQFVSKKKSRLHGYCVIPCNKFDFHGCSRAFERTKKLNGM